MRPEITRPRRIFSRFSWPWVPAAWAQKGGLIHQSHEIGAAQMDVCSNSWKCHQFTDCPARAIAVHDGA